jgi:tight adherence protein B
MDTGLALTLVVAFVAVVFGLEGAYLMWDRNRGPEVQRLRRRVRNLSAGGGTRGDLLKAQESTFIEQLLLAVPRLSSLDRVIEQSGRDYSVSRLLLACLGLGTLGFLVIVLLNRPMVMALLVGALATAAPVAWVLYERGKRLGQMEAQLPDAIDLIARAMRAGHAFPATLQMVAEDSPDPLAQEFRIVHDEMNFGLSVDDAFRNLAKRLPIDDVRFFVIAVLLQRETGGNLAEVLGNIGKLVRSRFKLLGKVKVLAAEGKLSAWILGLMPIVMAFLINLINPKFMSLLWTDPMGLNLVYACVVMYVIGIFWMWRLVKIRI